MYCPISPWNKWIHQKNRTQDSFFLEMSNLLDPQKTISFRLVLTNFSHIKVISFFILCCIIENWIRIQKCHKNSGYLMIKRTYKMLMMVQNLWFIFNLDGLPKDLFHCEENTSKPVVKDTKLSQKSMMLMINIVIGVPKT